MIVYPPIIKNKLRAVRNFVKKNAFNLAEKYLRVHITPVHFYPPIPNIGELKQDVFTKVNDCAGIDFSVNDQLNNMKHVYSKYLSEYVPPANSGLSQVDSFILYAMLRSKKPKVLIEIGSGESTKISLTALMKNIQEGNTCQFTAIEPFPKPFLI